MNNNIETDMDFKTLPTKRLIELICEQYKDKPDEYKTSLGTFTEVDVEDMTIYNLPRFEAYLCITMREWRDMLKELSDVVE